MTKTLSNLPVFLSIMGGCLASAKETSMSPSELMGFQFRPNGGKGPTYAGGMDYDKMGDSLYLTGGTYATNSDTSSCFFGHVDLQSESLTQMVTFGSKTKTAACTAVASNNFGNQRNAVLVGMTESDGLLTNEDQEFLQQGFAMDLATTNDSDKFEFLGGITTQNFHVSYPAAVVAGGRDFWTVSMVSDSGFQRIKPNLDKVISDEFPNYTPGCIATVSTSYKIHVEAFRYSRVEGKGLTKDGELSQGFESQWTQTLKLRNSEGSRGIDVAGMIAAGDENLFIFGTAFDIFRVAKGFVSKVSRDSGATDDDDWGQYLTPGQDRNFWITGACSDPMDPEHFYIVGATDGTIGDDGKEDGNRPVHAVIAKLNHESLAIQWTTELFVQAPIGYTGTPKASAQGCDIVNVDSFAYVAGTVEDGATMVDAIDTQSAGRDDIFVARLSTIDGTLQWMKQTGSDGDDRLSRNGGVKADKHGNAILYGDTTGDLFHTREDADKDYSFNDLFVMVFDKSKGLHKQSLTGPQIHSHRNRTSQDENRGGLMIFGGILLGVAGLAVIYLVYLRRSQPAAAIEKHITSWYDAAAADIGYYDDERKSVKSIIMNMFWRKRDAVCQQENLMYSDEPEDHADIMVLGNFHKNLFGEADSDEGMDDVQII